MKKLLIAFAILVVLSLIALPILKRYTKSFSPATTARYQKDGATVRVDYCQPSAKGRLIFGEKGAGAVVPFGQYWRVGANEATVFETNVPLLINGKELPAGKYSFYAFPGQSTWTLAFNTDWNRWGYSQPDDKKDVLRVDVPAVAAPDKKELLEIKFEDPDASGAAHANLQWDKTLVRIPFTKK